ncbi:MAG: DUF2207 family protein [Deinococcales bacterium]
MRLRQIILPWLVFWWSSAVAKSFYFDKIEQDIYFQADGRVRVIDTRTYSFNGDYSKAYLTVDSRGAVQFEGVQALDGKPFFGSSIDGNTLRWSYRASDESRTFQIIYSMSGELEVAEDGAKFDRQVLEPEHQAVRNYSVRLHAPNGSPDPFKVFVFSRNASLGTLTFDDPRGVASIEMQNVAEDEWVRTFVLLPAGQFTNRTQVGKQLDAWLEGLKIETAAFRNASAQAVARGGFAPPPPPPPAWLLGLPFVGVLFLGSNIWQTYQKYGREPYIPEVGKYYREPAEHIPPGVVPYVRGVIDPGAGALGVALSATLLDFTRRGFLELGKERKAGFLGVGRKEEVQFEIKKRPQAGELSEFEEEIWNLLNRAKGFDNIVTQSELRHYLSSAASSLSVLGSTPRRWYESTHGALLDSSDSQKTNLWIFVPFVVGIIMIGIGVLLLAGDQSALGGATLFAGFLAVLAGILAAVSLSRWNAEKLLNAKRWAAYRNFLTDFSQLETAPAEHLKLWDYHFVYAAALGVAQPFLKNIRTLAERYPQYYHPPYWIPRSYYADNSDIADLSSQLAAVNSLASLSSNLASLENALSSSTGTGGGFSGGSSGGSSGGGGSSGAS